MKVVFLDVDGVLNNASFFRVRRAEPLPRNHAIDRDAVELLNGLLERTSAVCVLSSGWRKRISPQDFELVLAGFGFRGRIIDRTRSLSSVRGDEIQEWLDRHPEVSSYVILDDGSDMGPVMHRLVRTSWETGIRPENVDQAQRVLETLRSSDRP